MWGCHSQKSILCATLYIQYNLFASACSVLFSSAHFCMYFFSGKLVPFASVKWVSQIYFVYLNEIFIKMVIYWLVLFASRPDLDEFWCECCTDSLNVARTIVPTQSALLSLKMKLFQGIHIRKIRIASDLLKVQNYSTLGDSSGNRGRVA